MSGERALRRKLALSDAIIQSIGEGICAVDGDGRFTFVNSVAERMLGWTEADLIGRQLHEILPAADASDRPSRLQDVVLSGGVGNVEDVFQRHDGTLLSVSVHSAPIVTSSEERGTVVVFRDLTQQRETEERLRSAREQAEQLALLERTKSEFLKVASHELRGPLAVLGGYLSMVEDGSVADPNSVMTILQTKVREMEQLVEKMLDTARLQEGNLELELEAVDLRDIVRHCVRTTRAVRGGRSAIQLHDINSDVPVLADRGRLQMVIDNLLENAIKFSPPDGFIDCTVRINRHWAFVDVRDRGHGIAPEDMAQLFTRFGRPVTKENSHVPGSGLGLYLARELSRLHGGDVRVESQPGKGSTFTLALPLRMAPPRLAKPSLLRRPKPAGQGTPREGAPTPVLPVARRRFQT